MRRGFKSDARSIAGEVRHELDLHSAAPLNPFELAKHLSIPVLSLSEMNEIDHVVRHFSAKAASDFSALTIFEGFRRLVVYNDAHVIGRKHADVAHELAHALLHHRPGPAFDERGCRLWDKECEDEATWLGGVLLVTDEAAMSIVRRGISLDVAAKEYTVSLPLMRWRINMSGARAIVRRANNRWHR